MHARIAIADLLCSSRQLEAVLLLPSLQRAHMQLHARTELGPYTTWLALTSSTVKPYM